MNSHRHDKLVDRIARAADAALKAENSVSPVDVLLRIGWLNFAAVTHWRQGRVDTRRAKARSQRHAVVVRFSKTRRRYERQGLMVEPQALKHVQQELAGREG